MRVPRQAGARGALSAQEQKGRVRWRVCEKKRPRHQDSKGGKSVGGRPHRTRRRWSLSDVFTLLALPVGCFDFGGVLDPEHARL